jgi:hypothetical protein
MGTILAQAVFDKVNRVLMDEQGVRWPDAELIGWLNSAQKEIATHKPNACTVNANISLTAGTKQALPATALSLIDVVRNMGGGSTPGRVITAVTRDAMDGAFPNWHSATAKAEVKHYIYDVRDPKVFYIFPPQPAETTQKVEAVYPVPPTDLTAITQAIAVDDIYEPRLVDYILYRCYSKSDSNPADAATAAGHANAFYSALGVKLQAESQFSPQKRNAANAKG